MPGKPTSVQELVELLRRPKVTSIVPAAPLWPSTLSASESTAHVVPDDGVEVELGLVVEPGVEPCAELVVVVLPFEAEPLGLLEHDANTVAPTSAAMLQSAVVTNAVHLGPGGAGLRS